MQVPKLLVEPSSEAKDLWRESMTLALQDVQGEFRVTLNGVSIVEGKDIPAGAPVRFKVPKNILKDKLFNVLAIRIAGGASKRGLVQPPVFGGYLDEVKLDKDWQILSGEAAAADLKPVEAQPALAFYTPADWHPANTILKAPAEPVRGRQVSPAEALAKLKTSEDLIVESLLSEPEVAQPTHVSFDERGRMWVAQYRQYPYPAGLNMISRDAYYRGKYDRVPPAPPHQDPGADIISVHEDKDGDGSYETHKNVLTGLNMANSALHGHGGIWVMNTPYLLFYPDANGDDIPEGDPEVRLAGFGLEDTHSVANGLTWGPDGWLYGAQGSTVTSHIIRPNIDPPNSAPIYLEGCAVWRYHPASKRFEIFADGSGNTFGLYFDAEGRLFSGHNGGDTRGWHHIQDGVYLKQGTSPDKFGPPGNPFAFGQMPSMAATHAIPRFSHNIIMMEGSAMPPAWRGQLLGADPLHQHLVASKRIPSGSTFITTDTGFPLQTDDMTFRPVYLTNSPDGSVTIADFREEYVAHGQNYQGQIDPSSGRIYRLRGEQEALEKDINLGRKTSAELVELLRHPNHWHRHTAVRLLAERNDASQKPVLISLLTSSAGPPESAHPSLEALWTLHQLHSLDDSLALRALHHPAPMVRAWTIRLLGDGKLLSPEFVKAIVQLAGSEPDAEVRAQILSTARRLPREAALALTKSVLQRDMDCDDAFIPLMAWFVIESHCAASPDAVVSWFGNDASLWGRKLVRKEITPRLMRRFASAGSRQGLVLCSRLLESAPDALDKAALLAGFEEAFKGRAMGPLPDELVVALAGLGKTSLLLRVRQSDAAAVKEALTLLAEVKTDEASRLLYARVFGEVKQAESIPVLLEIAKSQGNVELRKAAISSLSSFDVPEIGIQMVECYPAAPVGLRDAIVNLLASRARWTVSLLDAIEQKRVAKEVANPDLLARLRLHEDATLKKKLQTLFPAKTVVARESLKPRIEQIRTILGGGPGDPYAGEPIFMQNCAGCHKLFHKGGNVGPNLTSYQREDLGTMLISIVDPNAEIREGYANHFVTTKDGRTLGGFLADQDNNVIVLRGFDGSDITLQRKDVAKMQGAGASLMPEGLLEALSEQQLRDLFAYLRISQPISK